MTLAQDLLAKAQSILKAHATSQGYVILTNHTEMVGWRSKGEVKVVNFQCSPSAITSFTA